MFKPKVPFDPFYIILQILAMQCSFYCAYTFFLLLFDYLFDLPFNDSQIHNCLLITFKYKYGLITSASYVLAFVLLGIAFSFIVGKSRNALDFISTTFIIHLIFISIHTKFPTSISWWIFSIFLIIASTIIAISISLSYEMQSINVDSAFIGSSV